MSQNNNNEMKLTLTTNIVTSYLSNNKIATEDVPALIGNVFTALEGCGAPPSVPTSDAPAPAVPVRSSVKPDHVVCLVCGTKHTMLKRHLATAHDLTPEAYRNMFGLPANHALVAPNYSEKRSSLAKSLGLGRNATGRKRK